MPARDGTGPSGQGVRTGHGMGSCNPAKENFLPIKPSNKNQPFHWGGRVWDLTFGRVFRPRPANRVSRRRI